VTVHIVVVQEMPASREQTFDVLHDYGRRLQWDTLLRRAYSEGPPGRNTVAVCTARWWLAGYTFRTRYVTFDGDLHDDVPVQAVLDGAGARAGSASDVRSRDAAAARRTRVLLGRMS